MNEKEKALFFSLCKWKEDGPDEKLLSAATPAVLGHLFYNRMQGVAAYVLEKRGPVSGINREFLNALLSAREENAEKNRSYFQCIRMLSELLCACHCKVAMLKGARLCAHYPDGCRTASDIDLLMHPKDVTAIGQLLSGAGFRQGYLRQGVFFPATREGVIAARMTRGETVPYIKEVNLPFLRYLEVDLNFSLDYKNGDDRVLSEMLREIRNADENGLCVPTLRADDFFIHLCAHLHKEATTLPWIRMKRDMSLYKYGDLYTLLSEMTDAEIRAVFDRAAALGAGKNCAFAILETLALFDIKNNLAAALSKKALEKEADFCRLVFDPAEGKVLRYQTADPRKRFFLSSRIQNLKEIKPK